MARFWLMKTEPDAFSWEDLKASPDRTTMWDGVRNYQARNFLRDDMQTGDLVLFYHSGKKPAVVGIAEIVKPGYPDHTAWDPKSSHFDPRSTPAKPVWYMVDIQLQQKFSRPLPLADLRKIKALKDMRLLRKGNRLSVIPVTAAEFRTIEERVEKNR